MKTEYEEFLKVCVERRLERIANRTELEKLPWMIYRNQCQQFVTWFVERFPHLKAQPGFYGDEEHIWCVDTDGTIVDPTRLQFPHKAPYKAFEPATDIILIGKCMNCGSEIFGLIKDGPKELCDDVCGKAYENYIRREVARMR